MSGLAFVFPGQGSQAMGMGRVLYDEFVAARAVVEEVEDALRQRLSILMFEGPDDELTLTANAQPAIMTASIAAFRVLEGEYGRSLPMACVAGHSLGEYCALVAAGSLDLADCARVLRCRGQAMQSAVPVGQGAMAALLGWDRPQVDALLADQGTSGGVCTLANDNAYGQVVISGDKDAVDQVVNSAREKGVRKAVFLPVSAPFHCSLMAPAAKVMAEVLETVQIRAPRVPIVSNVEARPEQRVERLRALLVDQVTACVRWRESVEAMASDGVGSMIECGANVLSGLAKRIDKGMQTCPVRIGDDIDKALAMVEGI